MTYPPANTATAWYQDNYPGGVMDPNVGVIHTTEGTTRPTYSGGATAPNYTAVPVFSQGVYQRLAWFAHFPDNRSSRALRNEAGGVETNTLNALQVELVGTCAPGTRDEWRRARRAFVFWPDAPQAALEDLSEFVAWAHRTHGIPLRSPGAVWTPYPESYGPGGQRFGFDQWRQFYGWCGHQHVPENTHGDPGALQFGRVVQYAQDLLDDGPDGKDDETDAPPLSLNVDRVQRAFRAALDQDMEPTGRCARRHVRRLQRALNHVYPRLDLKASGVVDMPTLDAWAFHESKTKGRPRAEVPDPTSVRALNKAAGGRFIIRKDDDA